MKVWLFLAVLEPAVADGARASYPDTDGHGRKIGRARGLHQRAGLAKLRFRLGDVLV